MLQPNATFIGQIIVFLLLLWFIYAVVVPMIAKPVNERYKRIADGLVAAEAGQKQLEAANVQAKDILREARERARQIEDQAQRISQQTVESAKQEAYAEGARLIAAKQTEAANEVVRARDELRRDYGALVVQAASQLLEREVDARAHAQLLERLTEQVAQR